METEKKKIRIEFAGWTGKAALEYECETIKDAVEQAVEDGASLCGANLRCANLDGASLCGANLDGASLYGANLRCANLYGANLYGANLYGANLDGASLYGANLDGASLCGANLYGANLYGANLDGANLDGAKCGDKELWCVRPVLQLGIAGSRNSTTVVLFFADKSEPLVWCGCFSGTIAEFEAKIHERHAGTFYEVEYTAMVEYIKTIRKYQEEY